MAGNGLALRAVSHTFLAVIKTRGCSNLFRASSEWTESQALPILLVLPTTCFYIVLSNTRELLLYYCFRSTDAMSLYHHSS